MDVVPRVDQLLAQAAEEQVSEQRWLRQVLEALSERLDRMEEAVVALDERTRAWSNPGAATADLAVRMEKRIDRRLTKLERYIDDLAISVEQRALDGGSAQVAGIGDDLRRAVAELGRMLVRDRSRISGLLTEHHNAIAAEIRLPPVRRRAVGNGERKHRTDENGSGEVEPELERIGPAERWRRATRRPR